MSNPFEGMKMPMRIIVKADIVLGKGKVLKNRRGQDIKIDGMLAPDMEIAILDGKLIWSSVEEQNDSTG
jgi:hypothetical protein